ncbi:MAG: polysaccharide deacetylase family protein [Candidatus Omnitrophota bacterium]|nr:polysaccharide deacetylase family protein [Candidatus Omnitrophota bacterium]
MKKKLFSFLVIIILLTMWAIFTKPFYTVPILNYHSINTAQYRKDTPKVSPELFERQMNFIYRKGLKVISLDEYVEFLRSHKKIKNAIVITSDDGYDDNYLYAFPVLKKYGFPATIFIIEKHIGVTSGFLNYAQIKEMEKNHISFGSHTINHVYLPSVKSEEGLRNEIIGSKKNLEKKIGHRIDFICFPLGGYNEHIIELVKQAGYVAAFTTNRGADKLNRNIYAIKRIKITNKDNRFSLWFKTSGYFNLFNKFKKPN